MRLTQEQIDAINEKYLALMPEDSGDKEVAHITADGVLASIMKDLGFDEIVAAYESISKWYS